MKCTRSVVAVALLWLCTMPLAWADTTAPDGEPTVTVGTQIDTPVVINPPTIAPEPTLLPQDTPVVISQEHSTPVTQVQNPNPVPATPVPVEQPTSRVYFPVAVPTPRPQSSTENSPSPSSPPVSASSPPPDLSIPASVPQDASNIAPVDSNSNDLSSASYLRSAQAPAQLSCSGKKHPTSDPFLVSPYAGWTEVMSFDDHDNPDYQIDGKIVLANGLVASSSDGAASDLFPAYWSPSLRQFVNYDGHNGYDFDISYQPVLAAGSGTVSFAGWNGPSEYSGYGQMVLINHHNGYTTLYGHLSRLDVKGGDTVTAGQQIGISGTTGHSSGPHLHFSVFHDCNVTDPYGWTGHGTDPLAHFSGDSASYLWLPGHDPLLLNPPPNWPTYPLGLHLNLPHGSPTVHVSARSIPPVDRLLLMALPVSAAGLHVSTSVALSRTEATISQEAQTLTPELDDLVAQGLIQSYQVIAAAAAVWIRGTATAAQLEGLPGAASLTGVRPRDLYAAQSGLAHAVLMQTSHQEAPALWPVGFRSALHAWRPISTVMNGQALVAGVALPGQQVVVSLHRGSAVPAAAETTCDPETGGFVAMLHDTQGNPVPARSGDTIIMESGGRTSSVRVQPLLIRARAQHVSGMAPPGATVTLALAAADAGDSRQTIATANAKGQFQIPLSAALTGGTEVVASVSNAAGDQESASSFVPGITVSAGDTRIRGWTVAQKPILQVIRRGKMLIRRPINAASDGTFVVKLDQAGRPFTMQPGDAVRVGSRWHRRIISVPALSARITPGKRSIALTGPKGATVRLSYTDYKGNSWARNLTFNSSGRAQVRLRGGPAAAGDTCEIAYVTESGDTIIARGEATGLVLHEGKATLTGDTRRGAVISVHVLSSSGARTGGAVATADASTGTFQAQLQDSAGHELRAAQLTQIAMSDGVKTVTFSPPQLSIHLSTNGLVEGKGPAHAALTLTLVAASGRMRVQRIVTNGAGILRVPASGDRSEFPVRATLTYAGLKNVVIDRTATLRQKPAVSLNQRCTKRNTSSSRRGACHAARHDRGRKTQP